MLSIRDASKKIGLARSTIYQLVSARKIPHFKLGKRVAFDERDLDTWLASHRVPAIGEK